MSGALRRLLLFIVAILSFVGAARGAAINAALVSPYWRISPGTYVHGCTTTVRAMPARKAAHAKYRSESMPSELTDVSTTRRQFSSAFALNSEALIATRGGQVAGSIRNVNRVGGTTNCVNCVVATNATLAGRPASALLSGPTPISALEKTFGGTFGRVSGQSAIETQLLNAGHGAQGVVFGSRGPGQVGHVFNAINQNGVVRFLDGQTGGPASFSGFRDFFFMPIR